MAERDLWVRAITGDAEAFGRIFDLHRQRVFRHAFWHLGDTHDAEDATAAAFLELWRRRADVRVINGSVLPWLLVATGNICRNLSRGLRRHRALISDLPRGPGHERSAEEAALDRASVFDDAEESLAIGLRGLPRATRTLIALTALEGYSVHEAAAAVGMSVGAAKTRLSRARAALRTSSLAGAPGATRKGSLS